MRVNAHVLFGLGLTVFGAYSTSPTYGLQNYSLGQGANNTTASTSYNVELSSGEVVGVPSDSSGYTSQTGMLQAQQASVPPAPSLDNGSGSYYDKLHLTVQTGDNPADASYSIAVSTDNFAITSYLQLDGTLGATPLFQSYAQWGGTAGTTMAGLLPATTYAAKVSAMHGKFTHSAYGPAATSATVNSTISFSLSTNTVSLPTLLPGTIVSSPTMTALLSTNASYGASIYVSDSDSGLRSNSNGRLIASATAALGSFANGYGLQAGALSQTSGGPLTKKAPYDSSGNTVGVLLPSMRAVFSTSSAISGGSGAMTLLAKAAATDSAADDYRDTLSFISAASY